MTKQEFQQRIEALTSCHGYATHREREESDALLKSALDALDEYSCAFVCSACGAVAIHGEDQ